MAQTIAKREFFPNLDLLIIDECHIQRKVIQDFARQWGGRVIGLTATPIVKGLRETWETLVNATTTDALVADGHLAPVEIYAATEIDMIGATKTAGEWTASAVRERSGLIIGDIVSTWARYTSEHFGGPLRRCCSVLTRRMVPTYAKGSRRRALTSGNPPTVTLTKSPRRWLKGSGEASARAWCPWPSL